MANSDVGGDLVLSEEGKKKKRRREEGRLKTE